MAKVEPTEKELEKDARAANATAPKDPADAARAKLDKEGTVADRQAAIAKLQAEIDELQKPPLAKYPAWRYHEHEPPVLVHSEAEAENLGDGWVDSYDELPDVQARTRSKEKGKDKDAAAKPSGGAARLAHDAVAEKR